jgi:hypothetical protein
MVGWGERLFVRELMPPGRGRLHGNCVYCGAPSYGRVCRAHSDLQQIEHELHTEPAASHPNANATGSDNKGA